jgi:hypothetical protein
MLTKDLVGKLSPEQQEILAQMEYRRMQQRLDLLALARGNDWRTRYFPLFIFGVFLASLTLYGFDCFHVQGKPIILFLPLGMVLACSFFALNSLTNRRLDALLELMDFDRQPSNDEKHG